MNPENFNFPHLSIGYTGKLLESSTLNSNYYGMLFNEIKANSELLNNVLLFPQKIPRSGFFEELYQNETTYFKNGFNNILKTIKDNYLFYLNLMNPDVSDSNIRCFINWANIALRYSFFDFISKHFPTNYQFSYLCEIELVKELSKIELMLSNDKPICVSGLLQLANKYIYKTGISLREKIKLLVPLIVNFYRHQKESKLQEEIFKYTECLLEIIQQFENSNFLNTLYSSIAYRGIAMASEFSIEMKTTFLEKAEQLAKTIQCNSKMEKIIADDNLYTCYQTMSKWFSFKKDIVKAEYYLSEMIKLDPYDSTGYSELGLFYIKLENHALAEENFAKALIFGPPGMGMNAYYLAKSLEKQNRCSESISYLYKSTDLDTQAISPWLDLFEYFFKINEKDKVTEIAKHIFNSPILYEQLEEHEFLTIKNFTK